MLISMTGFGSATADDRGMSCTVELRSVNNRYFKAAVKLPDRLASLEPEIDRMLRESMVRGSIVLNITVKDHLTPASIVINDVVLKAYLDRLAPLMANPANHAAFRVDLSTLLALPGVVEQGEDSAEYVAKHRDVVLRLVKAAIDDFNAMRRREGGALWADLQKHLDIIRLSLGKIALHAPAVVKNYHERLRARVNQLVGDAKLSLSDHDLLKEVALFADRADISEEITRLGGHLDQFIEVCQRQDGGAAAGGGSGDGRKLDFIAQEMLREANTIASKANDAAIARLTVDIKSSIDRIKEQVQNAE